MKTPDRFEKMIPGWEQSDADDIRARMIPARDVITLLRRQHAAYVRLVKGIERAAIKVKKIAKNDHAQGMIDGIQCVLDDLDKYKKGKK